jgi:hypothetical protein
VSAEEYFAGHDLARAVFDRLGAVLDAAGVDHSVRITRTQASYRRRRGFAYVWMPGEHLGRPAAEAVVSFGLGHPLASERFKSVVRPAPHLWMHHLEIASVDDVDAEVEGWLLAAASEAG